MISTWTRNLKSETDKAKFEKVVFGSKTILGRLKEILQEQEDSYERSELDLKNYDQPNWSHKQAHRNGYRACLATITKLIDIDEMQNPDKEKIVK